MDVDWALIGKVMASKYRLKVLKLLNNKPMIPTQIAEATDKNVTHVSRTLKELTALRLIECLNPSARKGKLYALTVQGSEVIKKIKE